MGTKCLLCVSYCGKPQGRYKDKRDNLSAFQGLQCRRRGMRRAQINSNRRIYNYHQTITNKMKGEFRSGKDHILLEREKVRKVVMNDTT